MGLVKGDPVMLVVLFFGAAVLSLGGIYALVPATIERPTFESMAILVGLCLSLGFSLLVIGRVFWVLSKSSRRSTPAKASGKKSSGVQ